MSLWEILLLGVGLSMDAFAVALCKGLAMKTASLKDAVVIAAFFGIFQAIMPFAGWLAGSSFSKYIKEFDHWIAFGLLAFIGTKMIVDAVKSIRNPEETKEQYRFNIPELFLLAVATSIDALAVGLSFAFIEMQLLSKEAGNPGILLSIAVIGCTTFIISLAGVFIGNKFGNKYESKAEILGGVVLIIIGIKILVEHLAGA